ncbi:apolipoprotein N-acyltransferase [Thermomonospora cellulosilytica]|uniref:Apolipoprotein N-acyltransferase n=1 Tax=Thermomonospora cellulosilytica TaxID=1411118 RepID=A0A7W3MYW2_9ACTN|nr:apolipoprotein N-acyltransferase [Thermomonospora cellulosilytica]MBA9004430.1 apolipoprotein N-acyltransferase [Thermomonospora cellulosilytica]
MTGSQGRREVYARRAAAFVAGGLPLLAFPRPGLGWLAWALLVPGLLVLRAAGGGREAAVRGWWFGAGYLIAALYWTVPNIGPGLLLVAVVFGIPWALWGWTAHALLPARPVAALLVLPSIWVLIEYARSWHMLGGPWGLLGASQWRHPVMLSLAAVGGVWLIGFAIVAVNTALAIALTAGNLRWRALAAAGALLLAGPVAYAVLDRPRTERILVVALVQPGVVHDPVTRFAAGERITAGLPRADLVVWGESSVGFDLARRPDLMRRLTALADGRELMVNEDARDARGRISKSTIILGPDGRRGRYVKTRLVPFGEYIPFRPALGWLAGVSEAAAEDRVPGTGAGTLAGGGAMLGPMVCFESAFPDLGRALAREGAQALVLQSSTSTFQESWAPPQHASLAAVRAAETGRPVVQAALTGVSAAFDARGRRLAWLDTDRRGAVTVALRLPPATARTPFTRYGDYVIFIAFAVTAGHLAGAAVRGRRSARPGRDSRPLTTGTPAA